LNQQIKIVWSSQIIY